MSERRELLLTLSPAEQAALARDIARLRRRLGAPSATAVIIEAVRREAARMAAERAKEEER